jgi:hypothetical protein
MTEKPVAEIEKILTSYHSLLWHHCPDSRGCHGMPGMPDFTVIGPRGELWIEAKPHEGEHPHGGQLAWKYALIALGVKWVVWTPADIASGRVRLELEALL